eukprot:1768172-Rhodomonas_salina.2
MVSPAAFLDGLVASIVAGPAASIVAGLPAAFGDGLSAIVVGPPASVAAGLAASIADYNGGGAAQGPARQAQVALKVLVAVVGASGLRVCYALSGTDLGHVLCDADVRARAGGGRSAGGEGGGRGGHDQHGTRSY